MRTQSKEPLHVLEIIGNAIVGGMENYVYNLVRHLPSYGFKVSCLAPYESAYTASLRALGCDVYVTQMHVDVPWRTLQLTTELIRHNGIDLIHAHLPRAHALAGLAGRLTGRPALATFHGMEFNTEELSLSNMTGTHLITVCRPAFAQALALGIPPERVSLIPNGVDTRAFSPQRDTSAARARLGLPLDHPVVGFVGRLSYEKGPDQFIRLAAHVNQHRPDVHFALVGDGPMRAEVEELKNELGLAEVVHLPGQFSDMEAVYPALDLLAQTSRVEGMPFSILEAMASGLPVAAMSVGGVAEMIEVGTTGLTSAPEDPQGLGEAVLKLLEDPAQCRRMGRAGRKRVEETYNLYTSLRELSDLFRAQAKPAGTLLPENWPVPQNQTLPVKRSTS